MMIRIQVLFFLIISLFIEDVCTLGIIKEVGKMIEDVSLKETFCIPYNLYPYEITVIDDETVFWKSLNLNVTVEMFNKEYGEITICAPMKFIKDTLRPNCWTVTISNWAFHIDPNKSLEINLMGYKKLYDKSEYFYDSITEQATIFCFQGSFEPCAGSEKNFIKLGLDGETFQHYQQDNTTLKLFANEYGTEYIKNRPEYKHNPWVCFYTINMSTNPCTLWFIYNKTEFEILSDNSIRLKKNDLSFAPNEYKLINDGTIYVCIEDLTDTKLLYSEAEGVTTLVAFSLSLIGLTLFILAFTLFQELRIFSRKVVFCFSISLFFAQLFFIVRLVVNYNTVACQTIGILNHFFFLSTFFWMGVISYDVSITILKSHVNDLNKEEQFKRLLRFSIVSWGGSAFVVFIAIMVDQLSNPNDFQPKYEEICWISNKKSALLFLNSFIALIILMNICLFSVTAAYIIKTTRQTAGLRSNDNKRNTFIIFLRLAILMGLCWIFGILDFLVDSDIVSYIFILLNAPQGLYIFLTFTFVNGVKIRLRNCFCTQTENKQDWPTTISVSSQGPINRKSSTCSKEIILS